MLFKYRLQTKLHVVDFISKKPFFQRNVLTLIQVENLMKPKILFSYYFHLVSVEFRFNDWNRSVKFILASVLYSAIGNDVQQIDDHRGGNSLLLAVAVRYN